VTKVWGKDWSKSEVCYDRVGLQGFLTASNCNLTVKGAGLREMRDLSFIIQLLRRFVIKNLLRAFFQPLSSLKLALLLVKG
jgi:hypothetical protein